MTAKQQYREAYRLTRQLHSAAQGKSEQTIRTLARAFTALEQKQGIDWEIRSAAQRSYIYRLDKPGPSVRYLVARLSRGGATWPA